MYTSCSICILKSKCNNKKLSKNGKRLGSAKDKEKCAHDKDIAYSQLTDSERNILIDQGYEDLAYAIIERALEDIVHPDKAMNRNEHITDNPLKFLQSNWASVLSGVSNEKLMEVLAKYEQKAKGNDK